ncbi:MAG TPA: hypothetical protein VGE52_17745, partial [Pirellulales bacterium]
FEATGDEGTDELTTGGGTDDEATPEPAAARKAPFPSSMGLSVLLPKETTQLRVVVRWGDYRPTTPLTSPTRTEEVDFRTMHWRRTERVEELTLKAPATQKSTETEIPNSSGLFVVLSIRPIKKADRFDGFIPPGARSASVFLVNRRRPTPDLEREVSWAFQTALQVHAEPGFVARANVRGLQSNDWDERVADLQYRDACEYAVGHGVAARANLDATGACQTVETCWIPSAEVERVAPADIEGVELGMEALAMAPDGAALHSMLIDLADRYRDWIAAQDKTVPPKPEQRRETATELLTLAKAAAKRIEAGVKLLADE